MSKILSKTALGLVILLATVAGESFAAEASLDGLRLTPSEIETIAVSTAGPLNAGPFSSIIVLSGAGGRAADQGSTSNLSEDGRVKLLGQTMAEDQ